MSGKYYFFIGLTFIMIACGTSGKIKNGEGAYERKQYSLAVNMLMTEFETTSSVPNQARKAYLLGKSFTFLKNDKDALYWYEIAARKNYGPEAIRDLAYCQKSNGQYKQAINSFEKLISEVGSRTEIRREIGVCQEAINWIKAKNQGIEVNRSYVNSVQADYSPVIYEDDYIVFTSDRGTSEGTDRYQWTGNKFSDLYLMSKNGSAVQPFDGLINTDHNEGTPSFNKDYTEMYFTRCYSTDLTRDAYCKLMYTNRLYGNWSEPVPLPFQEEGRNYGHPALIENDSVLIFAATPENSVNEYDLYYTTRLGDGTYSEPLQMPNNINTQGNEMFPHGDGDTLYFSSDYLPGLGGLDIFRTYLDKNRKWTEPERLPVPINSPSDDFSLVVDRTSAKRSGILEMGYFSSSRSGIGDDDIYNYTIRYVEPEEPEVVSDDPVDEPAVDRDISYYLAGRVVEPVYAEVNNPNTSIIGYRPIDLSRVRVSVDTGIIATFTTDRSGSFIQELEEGNDYLVYAGKNRYLNNSVEVTTSGIEVNETQEIVTINVQVVLTKIYKGREIVLSDIYYDLDKAEIREDAKPALDALVKILNDNPDIRIQLSSHTDCRAEDDYNLDLSQRRAISAVKYIISKGIDQTRLVPKGYGETQLAIDCVCEECTEEQHQANRRTTFKIIT